MTQKWAWIERMERAEDRLRQLQIPLLLAALAVIALVMVFDVRSPIASGPNPHPLPPTSHEVAIATRLLEDPVYIDPELRDQVLSDLVTPSVRQTIESCDPSVFVVVSRALAPASAPNLSELLSGSAQRIAEAVGRDGTYLIVDGSGANLMSLTRHSGGSEAQRLAVAGVLEPDDLQQAVIAADTSSAGSVYNSDWLMMGVAEGVGLSVIAWFLWRSVQWLSQRTWHSSRWEGFE